MTTNAELFVANEAPPALFVHCCKVYELMQQESVLRPMPNGGEDALIWEGSLTQLITRQANLALPFYTSVTRRLKSMGCIHSLRRGGGSSPSVWQLLKEPEYGDYLGCGDAGGKGVIKKHDQVVLVQRVNDLSKRVLELEEQQGRIIRVIRKIGLEDGSE